MDIDLNIMNIVGSKNDSNVCKGCKTSLRSKRRIMELKKGKPRMFLEERMSNEISTAKYTMINFVPRTLLNSFSRVGNLFFLAISLIMLIDKQLSPFKNWIVIFPLGIFTFVYMCKEALLDYRRRKTDRMTNEQ
jgi:hypothetical protein